MPHPLDTEDDLLEALNREAERRAALEQAADDRCSEPEEEEDDA
jgi:hypothetical protein